MPKRNLFDLSHQSHMTGRIGSLQTLTTMHVVAGDSMSLNLSGLARLSPLRRNLTIDCRFDLFVFYVPHRHLYKNWEKFLQDGVDGTETLRTIPEQPKALGYLGEGHTDSGTSNFPFHYVSGYNYIWNRYFRIPNYQTEVNLANIIGSTEATTKTEIIKTGPFYGGRQNEAAFNYKTVYTKTAATDAGTQSGRECAHIKTIWSTGIRKGLTSADSDITVTDSKISLLDINKINARYKTEQQREWFTTRYADLLKRNWGGSANTDADERPTLIMRKNNWLSGYDVDGTSDTTLGQYSGKAMGKIQIAMPRKYFPEHGMLWIMCLPRFPSIHYDEKSYLAKNNPTYKEIACDYEILKNEPPRDMDIKAYFNNHAQSGWESNKQEPYGQWYRAEANRIHDKFHDIQGYPFTNTRNSTIIKKDDYDQMFTSLQLQHWTTHCSIEAEVFRSCPTTQESIYAGVLK